MKEDYATSEEALAGAIHWAISKLPGGAEIESVNFGHRGRYYWYAVTYQRWQNEELEGVLLSPEEERASRIRKVAAAWAVTTWTEAGR